MADSDVMLTPEAMRKASEFHGQQLLSNVNTDINSNYTVAKNANSNNNNNNSITGKSIKTNSKSGKSKGKDSEKAKDSKKVVKFDETESTKISQKVVKSDKHGIETTGLSQNVFGNSKVDKPNQQNVSSVVDSTPEKEKQHKAQPSTPAARSMETPLTITVDSQPINLKEDGPVKVKVPHSPLRIDLKPFDYESLSPRSPNSPSGQSLSPRTPTSPFSPPYLGARPRSQPSPKKVVECIQLVADNTEEKSVGTMEAANSQEVWDRCTKALRDAGATDEFSHFFADILRTEFDMNGTLNRIHQTLGPDNATGRGKDPAKMLKVTQDLVKNYNHCKTSVETLQERGKKIPPLTLDPNKVKGLNVLTSLCKLETKELNLQEGDQIWVTDTSRPNRLKIRNSRGEEGYVPALCCILPTPDKSAVTAIERLQIQLLASWVENVKKMRKLMMECLLTTSKILNSEWRALMMDGSHSANKDRITRRLRRLSDLITKTAPNWDLNKLHNALFSLEKELDTWHINGMDMSMMVETISNLDKSVLVYQMFTKQLYLFRKSLERVSRPIRIVESWDNLRAVQKGRFFR